MNEPIMILCWIQNVPMISIALLKYYNRKGVKLK